MKNQDVIFIERLFCLRNRSPNANNWRLSCSIYIMF